MRLGPDITRIAALLGDPARANMLSALMGGQALTAGELAREAGITPQTASSHLAQLEAGGLLTRRIQGRHNYFALAGRDVAEAMEQLALLAGRAGHMRTRPGPKDPAMRRARVCYDHLAGDAGVAMLDALVADGRIEDRDGSLVLTDAGRTFARDFGACLETTSRRPLCKACLDWSVRRSHLSGVFGAALLDRIYALGWARRVDGTRVVAFSAPGLAAFERAFGPVGREAAA
ncbi:helix-turn-helix transcriptional regulator [Phenylobacterium sp.]|uniref:ArsR/SmtB family transcription factor n=1 Tax=Phenylobacterium sp. TaxID=1871053 RepID=UPI0025FE1355|nr:winged helix-turn-helix domain-containing protein [Phenylobacterium sp.]MBX3481901.1 winged helix-turn-helix transcriptional regulator [Phenylobacterium sp.]MCW5758746.1 winged helix-turn-helix transcriptional regulator [Phenylobacterium sp.]